MPSLEYLRSEIERMRTQISRQRNEILQLQRAGISTASAASLLLRMQDKVDGVKYRLPITQAPPITTTRQPRRLGAQQFRVGKMARKRSAEPRALSLRVMVRYALQCDTAEQLGENCASGSSARPSATAPPRGARPSASSSGCSASR